MVSRPKGRTRVRVLCRIVVLLIIDTNCFDPQRPRVSFWRRISFFLRSCRSRLAVLIILIVYYVEDVVYVLFLMSNVKMDMSHGCACYVYVACACSVLIISFRVTKHDHLFSLI